VSDIRIPYRPGAHRRLRRAVRQLISTAGYSYPDHMHVAADSIRIDLACGIQVTAGCLTSAAPSAVVEQHRHSCLSGATFIGRDAGRWAP
jgi:hypothetical protein